MNFPWNKDVEQRAKEQHDRLYAQQLSNRALAWLLVNAHNGELNFLPAQLGSVEPNIVVSMDNGWYKFKVKE